MSTKPIIQDQAQLTPVYARYREHLCRADSRLDTRLRNGDMRKVEFSTLSRDFDVILLDAFGVLNRGKEAIAGAPERVALLKKAQRPLLVVSNNASQSPKSLEKRFHAMGFEISTEEIISSGMAVRPFVASSQFRNLPYYLVGTVDSALAYAPEPERLMVNPFPEWRETMKPATDTEEQINPQTAKYILLCSNRDYYGGVQQQQVESLLTEATLPVLLANPDLVAPNAPDGLEAVAGYTAAEWVERFHCEVMGIGKPFPTIFSLARQRFPHVAPERFLMVGDTLDTDILGGAVQGFRTCLTLSGVYEEEADNLEALCNARAIRPDFVVQSIAT